MQEQAKETLRKWKYHLYTLKRPSQNIYSDKGFHHYKCIFFHIPKTGGVSINKSLFKNLGLGHITVDFAKEHFSHEMLHDYFKFSIVRNPYTRLFSSFWFLKNGGFDEKDKIWAEENLSDFKSFESFVMEWINEDNCHLKRHFFPQHHFITDPLTAEVFVDFCGRFEQLNKGFDFICKKIKIKKQLLFHSNKIKNTPDDRLNLSLEMKKRIISCYAKDFELFDYSMLL